MHSVLTVVYFVLIAYATAKPAYNYDQPKQGPPLNSFNLQPQQNYVASLPAPAPQFVLQNHNVAAPQSQYVSSPAPAPVPAPVQQFVNPPPQYVAPAQHQHQHQHQQPQQQQQQLGAYNQQYQQPRQPQTVITKEIYVHSAPEETVEIGEEPSAEPGRVHKNYRILFLRAPVHNLKLNVNALKRAQAAKEEKTVVYVLTKKPDLSNLHRELASVQNEQKTHKPEVFFIKYNTQEEANHAQQEIQAQYDALGGETNITDEGISPVSQVVNDASFGDGSAPSSSNNAPLFSRNSNFNPSSFQGNQGAASSAVGFASPKYLPKEIQ